MENLCIEIASVEKLLQFGVFSEKIDNVLTVSRDEELKKAVCSRWLFVTISLLERNCPKQ
jgi:hypothetical protein